VTQSSKSNYKAVIVSPEQAFRVMMKLEQPYRTLVFLVAVTGLRISEALGLTWGDLDYDGKMIHLRRVWVGTDLVEHLKTEGSGAPVPLGDLLADTLRTWYQNTPYGQPKDWVFASAKTHGRTPRVGNMLVADHPRPAAIKAGVVLKPGQRFGFHNLRHSLSSLLITEQKPDVRTTQDILRHSSSATTIDLYTQSPMAQRIAAQESVLRAILVPPARVIIRGIRRRAGHG
jgi:integrase